MIGAAAQLRDLDIAIFLAILIIGMYVVPSLIRGVRTYRAGVDLARQLYRERDPTWAKLVRTFGVDRGECMADVVG